MVAFNTEVGRLASKLDAVDLKYCLMSAILSILENRASNHMINQRPYYNSRELFGKTNRENKTVKKLSQPFTEFKYHEKTNYTVYKL